VMRIDDISVVIGIKTPEETLTRLRIRPAMLTRELMTK